MDAASGAQVSTVGGAAKRAFGWTRAGVRLFILSLIGALIVVVAREWDWWVGSASLQSTDDAYLRADTTPLAAPRTYQWIHSLSRIVTALLDAGLRLEFIREHPLLPWPPFPMCVKGDDGFWRLPESVPSFPLSLSLRARKPLDPAAR